MKPTNNLFDGMKESDGSEVRNAFSEYAMMYRLTHNSKAAAPQRSLHRQSSSGPIWGENQMSR